MNSKEIVFERINFSVGYNTNETRLGSHSPITGITGFMAGSYLHFFNRTNKIKDIKWILII